MTRPAAVATLERFTGFPEGGLEFFLELQAEQSRTWFKAHQADFERLWKHPLELFMTDLQDRLVDTYPQLAEVAPHFFRIQRDTRFARDKTPYKTYVAAHLPVRPGPARAEDNAVPGLYVSFGLESDYVGVGTWHMSPDIVNRFRLAVDHASHGADLQRIIDGLRADGFGIESMDSLKRTPPPYAADHPRADLLKRKGLAAGIQVPEGLQQSPALLDWAEQQFRRARPLVDWLERHLTP